MTNPATTMRAKSESFRARELHASLTVNDLAKSVAWYTEVVGFTVNERHERDGKLLAVSIVAGDVELVLGQDDGANGANRAKGEGFSLRLTTVQNIDRVAERGAAVAARPLRRGRRGASQGGRGTS